MAKGGKGKGKGGKKGGAKGAKGGSASDAGATGTRLQPPTSLPLWKGPELKPIAHRSAPQLMPHRPAPEAPMLITKVPVAVVRAALADEHEPVLAWLIGGGSIDATWDRPDGSARGFTLLMLASVRGLLTLVETLLRRGARTGPRNSAGATALILAAHHGRRSIVHRLLMAGARADVRANPPQGVPKGPTALDVAERHDHLLTAELLRTHELSELGKPPTELSDLIAEAAAGGDVTVVTEWLDVGGKLEAPHRASGPTHTLLLLASTHGHEALVDALLKRRASTAVKTTDGSTPMMLAAFGGHAGVTRRLLLHQLRHREAPAFYSPRSAAGVQQFVQSDPVPEYALEFRGRQGATGVGASA